MNKRVKQRQRANPEASKQSKLLELKPDGTLIAHIAFWRYLFFALLFAAAFLICLNILVRLYQERPPDFWKRWDDVATMGVIVILAIAMPYIAYGLLKNGYKKVQLEINGHSVRYLRRATRGGTLLSDHYVCVPLKDIHVELHSNPFGGGMLQARTAIQTHSMILLLSPEEQEVCLKALQEAIKAGK
jgi:hypothetical protein